MVLGVTLAQPLEDLDRLFGVGRVHGDRLESPLQRCVFLDVLAVLVEGGGADALDLAAGQGRLEHVGGVDRALRSAGADQRVQLVDKQDHVLGPAHFVHHGLDSFLELASVLGAGDHHRQIQNDQPPIVQQIGHLLVDDLLGQTFDDRGLAHARLAQQHRVVLRATAQDLDKSLDFILSADDGVELAAAGQFGEVAAEAVKGGGLALAAAR